MPAKAKPAGKKNLNSTDLLPFLLVLLYASVELLNGESTSDVMGDQWFMISILNIVSLLAFAIYPGLFGIRNSSLFRHPIILACGVLILISATSTINSINQIESLVVLTRLINGMLMILVIASLLRDRTNLFRWLAAVLSVILLIQSILVINQFFNQIEAGEPVNAVIFNLKLNAANKNILAAMFIFKSCLVIYCSNSSKTLAGHWLFALILIPASFAIFLINARASFIALILIIVLNYGFLLITRPQKLPFLRFLGMRTGPLLAILLGFLISVPVLKNALKAEPGNNAYGTLASRLSSIDLTVAGSNSRVAQWKAAITHIEHHPLLGAGIGNWKLASIPYEKETVDDLLVAYHVHNDYLEITAETGILGGLLYLTIFFLAGFYALRFILSEKAKEDPGIAIFTILALAGYSIDAFFNFPLERPVMQFYFSLIIALAISLSYSGNLANIPVKKGRAGFILLAMLALPFSYIALQTSRSLKEQRLVNKDMMAAQPQTRWQDIMDIFPPIPDLNAYAFPIEQVKAIYLLNDKKYSEAMERVKSSEKVNPYLSLTEFLKARIYSETGKMDSARFYIAKAFEMKPRAKSHYLLYSSILTQQKDTQQLKNVFTIYNSYRKEPATINDFIVTLVNLGSPASSQIALIDSSLKNFPGDTTLTKTREALLSLGTRNNNGNFSATFQRGLDLFSKKEFNKAIVEFNKAWEMEKQYLCLENIGLCYYSSGRYREAINYFDKIIQSGLSSDGKSEFFKGASLVSLGKAADACPFLTLSKKKNYPEAADFINKYCR